MNTVSATPGIPVAPVTPEPTVPILYAQLALAPMLVAAIHATYDSPVVPLGNPAAEPFQ
jgi:hypothetical protein